MSVYDNISVLLPAKILCSEGGGPTFCSERMDQENQTLLTHLFTPPSPGNPDTLDTLPYDADGPGLLHSAAGDVIVVEDRAYLGSPQSNVVLETERPRVQRLSICLFQ